MAKDPSTEPRNSLFPDLRENFPVYFVSTQLGRFLFVGGFLIPLIFMVMTRLDVAVAPVEMTDLIALKLAPLWPVLPENYERMKELGRLNDAKNYASFFLVMLGFGIFLSIYAVRKYFRQRIPVKFPDIVIDGVIIFGGGTLYHALSRSDRFNVEFSLRDFYLDQFGFWFFKEYVLVTMSLFVALVLMIFAIRIFHRPGRRSSKARLAISSNV